MSSERDVTVRGTPAAIEEWLGTLDGSIAASWSRAPEIEHKVKGRRNGRWPICLVWSGNGGHPRTAIFLQPVSDHEVGVMSIVALDQAQLAPEDRAATLEAFRTAIVTPRGGDLRLAERPATVGLSELISPRAQARFTAFARMANKAMLHSGLDLPRWYDFLIQLHRDGASPPREALEAALKDESFSPAVIGQLLDAYEHMEGILGRYDALGGSE
ncbi:MAG: hypothetical protein ACYC61_22335 [Isosphaeraceae bacterium]